MHKFFRIVIVLDALSRYVSKELDIKSVMV